MSPYEVRLIWQLAERIKVQNRTLNSEIDRLADEIIKLASAPNPPDPRYVRAEPTKPSDPSQAPGGM